ncbi:MAG: hypothetical protein M1821_008941 [Bathelium mastoideum]|nr:MAG: hypothetical protein M1821_008941 [Bathelium mastoideum]
MSKPSSSSRRRRSFLNAALHLTPLTGSTTSSESGSPAETRGAGNVLKKRATAPTLATTHIEEERSPTSEVDENASPKGRPSMLGRSSGRPGSLFGSLRSLRSTGEDDTPLTATSSHSPSGSWEVVDEHARNVLHHGEVQTSSGMFRKKKEYLVITDSHIMRFKGQIKASEAFSVIPSPLGRSQTKRHSSVPSGGSAQDLQSLNSSDSGERDMGIPLRHVVAVHRVDDGRPFFTIEIDYLDDECNNASCMSLQLSDPDDRDLWLNVIRNAASNARFTDPRPIPGHVLKRNAHVVGRNNDYDPDSFNLYKIVQRPAAKASGRSAEDLAKIASTICYLAIGLHKVHIIPLYKRTSSPFDSPAQTASYGIMNLTSVRLSEHDDNFELSFRRPLCASTVLHLASSDSVNIAIRLRHIELALRPEWTARPYTFSVPQNVERDLQRTEAFHEDEHCSLDKTLIAYCVAYDINPSNIRYTINYTCEDAPRFELCPSSDYRADQYSVYELLAVMRALRYNETFGSLSFSGIKLDSLNHRYDPYGTEHVCYFTKRGTEIPMDPTQLQNASLLVQEVRALAVTSKKTRRMDFSNCITGTPPEENFDVNQRVKDPGCGVAEAIFPLCRHLSTNVDWICLNGIQLGETDLDYLIHAAADRICHLRAIELARCGLNDRRFGLILDGLRGQCATLEALEFSGNKIELTPNKFESQINVFTILRKLRLTSTPRIPNDEPIIPAPVFIAWRLDELRLSRTPLNQSSIEALCCYLHSPRSETLRELSLDRTSLTGSDLAVLMHSMTREPGKARNMHIDISQNHFEQDHAQFAKAIASGLTPQFVSLPLLEYEDEGLFRHLISAFRVNKSIKYLDISRLSLPDDATDETCECLRRMLAENDTLEELDLSGEESKLEVAHLGVGLNTALRGLGQNKSLRIFRVQHQKLGLQGAQTLADVVRENTTLRELYCDYNEIPLGGFTDLVNSLHRNTTLLHLPQMDSSKSEHLRSTEREVKTARDTPSPSAPPSRARPSGSGRLSMSSSGSFDFRGRIASTIGSRSPLSPSSKSSPSSPKGGFRFSRTVSGPMSSGAQSVPQPQQLSDQDIRAALRLVDESWERQQWRLNQYLQRNYDIMSGKDVDLDIPEEDFEKPDTVTNLGKLLEEVKTDSTPTAEKDVDLGLEAARLEQEEEEEDEEEWRMSEKEKELEISEKMLDAGHHPRQDSKFRAVPLLSLDIGLNASTGSFMDDEPDTPTQKEFAA